MADVEQIAPQELMQRKMVLMMVTIKEPQRLQSALASLWAAYLAVLATLRLEFARTTAIALGIVEMIRGPTIRHAAPPLSAVLGEGMAHWTQTIIESTLSFVAIALAWCVRRVLSAFLIWQAGRPRSSISALLPNMAGTCR